jgi:hypothetical protein
MDQSHFVPPIATFDEQVSVETDYFLEIHIEEELEIETSENRNQEKFPPPSLMDLSRGIMTILKFFEDVNDFYRWLYGRLG